MQIVLDEHDVVSLLCRVLILPGKHEREERITRGVYHAVNSRIQFLCGFACIAHIVETNALEQQIKPHEANLYKNTFIWNQSRTGVKINS